MRRPILLVSHQFDYSGAPLALLSMARALKELDHDVHVHTLRDGPLRQDFEALGLPVNAPISRANISAIIASTVLTIGPALRNADGKIPVVGWVHESLEFLPLLKLTPDTLGLESLAAAIFPTAFPASQFEPYLRTTPSFVIPYFVDQSHRPPTNTWVYDYCVTGPWDKRKDQRTLLHHLSEISPGGKVAVIGNQRPADFRDNGLELFFFGEVLPHVARRLIADSRYLISNSLAETQNIAAVEALLAGRNCVLSDIPVHRALAELSPMVTIFERHRPEELRKALQRVGAQYLTPSDTSGAQQVLEERFGWKNFRSNVEQLLQRVAR